MSWYKNNQFDTKPETAREAMEMAKLDWSVGKVPVEWTIEEEQKMDFREVENSYIFPGKCVTYRKDNNQPLGVVGKDYSVVQNNRVFDFFDPVVNDGEVEYYGAGAFNFGRVIWLQLRLTGKQIELGKDDNVEKYMLLLNSHNLQYSLMAMFTPIRVVCQNTLNVAISVAKKKESGIISIKHTKSMDEKIQEAKKVMRVAIKYYDNVGEIYKQMTLKRLSSIQLLNYANEVINVKNPTEKNNRRSDIMSYVYGSPGADKYPGSLWNAYNGFTYYADHQKKLMKKSKSDTPRQETILFGASAKMKTRAFNVALEYLN